MAKADKEYTYYRDKHILFEGDVIVFKRPKSTPDEERERATHERWQTEEVIEISVSCFAMSALPLHSRPFRKPLITSANSQKETLPIICLYVVS